MADNKKKLNWHKCDTEGDDKSCKWLTTIFLCKNDEMKEKLKDHKGGIEGDGESLKQLVTILKTLTMLMYENDEIMP